MAEELDGVWRTVGGRRIFIKNGEDLKTAMKNSGKFGKKQEEQNKKGKDTYKIPSKFLHDLENRENGNYYVAEITPDQYLKITSSENLIKSIEEETKQYGELDLDKLNSGYMMLEVDLDTGKVSSHEGRHRMQLLKNNGYKKAQIIIMSKKSNYDKNWGHDINSLHLTHQIENEQYRTTITNLKIINKK